MTISARESKSQAWLFWGRIISLKISSTGIGLRFAQKIEKLANKDIGPRFVQK